MCLVNSSPILLAGVSFSHTNCTTCIIRQRSDLGEDGRIRWALPLDEQIRCNCTTILAVYHVVLVTPGDTPLLPCKPDSSAYWFTDDYEMIIKPELRGTEELKCLMACPCEGKL